MIFGNFKTYEVTVGAGTHAELDISDSASTEKEVRINPGVDGIRVLFTPASSSAEADASDYLLENGDNAFEVGRSSTRLSFYNTTAGEVKVSVAVGY